jgi:hypothetical protein
MRKPYLLIVLLLIAACTTACGQTAKGNNGIQDNSNKTGAISEPAKADPAPAVHKLDVHVYMSNNEMIGLEERTAHIEYVKTEDKYLAALKALQIEDTAGVVSLWKNALFNSAVLKDGKLTVDLSLPGEARLGAPGEELALESIEKTAFQFGDVDALDLLVDGEAVDSLMGHEELEHPIVRPQS